ncbi:MAG TPA: SpoIVB peptidase [Clostridiales bacterium]|jgi:stage IV sporulation protein B|nr:SpoIVB peptidase [Clostridiales bacterium]HCS11810.1 SpoIVB peptidase [Clostridiales bacterium]
MRNFVKRVLFFTFFIAVLMTAVFFGFNLKTNPYKFAKGDQVVDTDGKYIMPGGQTIGVELTTEGVLVVGLADIVNADNISISPAKNAGIQIGDKILEIDSQKLGRYEIIDYTESKGLKQYNFKVEREGKIYNFTITPVQRYDSDEIKFGFWARDDIAGIGTVTFVDPETGLYSAIGHGISDSVTGNLIDIESGTISKANITSIKLGKKGEPGEIIGYILKEEESLGTVLNNTNFGIYGEINKDSIGYFSSDLMEIGKKEEIQLGPAYIIACVNNEIKKYSIEISKIFYQNKPDEKSFVIRITDKELLEMTNGIIQGMSGSPVIQNNKIVGAVTHVFMNDPTKGYGIYIEWVFENIYE